MAWYGFSDWRGLDGRVTRKTYMLQEMAITGVAFENALAQAEAITNALDAVTEATLQDFGVTHVEPLYQAGLGNISVRALVNVWAEDTENPNDVLSISSIDIPAPVVTIFQGTSGAAYNVVDPADTLLQAFVNALSDNALISDMEKIDTGAGVAGIENGRRVTRKLPKA